MIVESITDLIGNTPLLKIPAHVHGLKNVELYGKMEMMNPFGSVKDRTAWGMIKDDLEMLKERNMTIFENSSGNTAKSLQAIAGLHGLKVRLVTGLGRVPEQRDMILQLGADIEEFAAASDCFDASDPNDPQFLIEKAVREHPGEIYFPSQFTNAKNPEYHYDTTGKEIVDDLGRVDFFYGGLGTTGSSLGVNRRLLEANPKTVCVGVAAAKHHFIPGIRSLDQMWESGLFERENYQELVSLKEGEVVDAMLELNRKVGLLCGPSSAANYLGAVQYLQALDAGFTEKQVAVFLVCDRAEWYVSYVRDRRPDVFKEEMKPNGFVAFDMDDVDTAPQMEPEALNAFIAEKNPLVIDVRSSMAYGMKSIPGAINIPVGLFEKLIDDAEPFPKDRPILLVCAVGEKTKKHAAYLQGRGYEVYSVKKGMRAVVTNLRVAA